jgi:crossover junction endodeoxyribonuclease RuvC
VIILGIDPGLAIVGWGVLEYDRNRFRPLAYGSINTPAGMETAARLALIHRDLTAIIDRFKPTQMAVEELFFTKNITTGIRVAEARGVILMTGQEKGLELAEYTPMQVKQAVVGYGAADKRQVISMVTRILNLPEPPKPDDTADALAIAICHAHSGCSRLGGFYNRMQ